MKPLIHNGTIDSVAIDEFINRVRGAARGITLRCGDDYVKQNASINSLYQTALRDLRMQFPLTRDRPDTRLRLCELIKTTILMEAGHDSTPQ